MIARLSKARRAAGVGVNTVIDILDRAQQMQNKIRACPVLFFAHVENL